MTKALMSIYLVVCSIISMSAVTIHHGLVIGLGEQEDPNWGKINGDNDVRYVVRMLENLGYTDIRTLKNRAATKAGIVNALTSLADRCSLGDKVYIHYSGHGQLITDLNGDEAVRWNGWHAQWDESLIPYDAYMMYCPNDHGEKHLTDDELEVLLTAIRKKVGKKGEIIMVIDACHSGDATRGELDEIVRGIDIKFNIPRKPDAETITSHIQEQWLTISACRPYQLSTEIKRKRVGKLTFALYSLGASFFKLNNRDMEHYLEKFMKRYEGKLPQTPMVTGNK